MSIRWHAGEARRVRRQGRAGAGAGAGAGAAAGARAEQRRAVSKAGAGGPIHTRTQQKFPGEIN